MQWFGINTRRDYDYHNGRRKSKQNKKKREAQTQIVRNIFTYNDISEPQCAFRKPQKGLRCTCVKSACQSKSVYSFIEIHREQDNWCSCFIQKPKWLSLTIKAWWTRPSSAITTSVLIVLQMTVLFVHQSKCLSSRWVSALTVTDITDGTDNFLSINRLKWWWCGGNNSLLV